MQKFGMKLKIVLKKNNNEGECDKDYMKITFNSDDDIPLNKQLNFPTITVLNFPTITVIVRNILEVLSSEFFRRMFV